MLGPKQKILVQAGPDLIRLEKCLVCVCGQPKNTILEICD